MLSTGDILDGKYRIGGLLGKGGMGAVYEGEHLKIHRRVAIKVLHAAVAENEVAAHRFEREAEAAGRIGSDHIVEVLDVGELEGGDRYMVMEFLEGRSLHDWLGREAVAPEAIVPIVVELLEGLAAAHQAGIVHRDLKPANVFLTTVKKGLPDFVKILDFGVSKFGHAPAGMEMTATGAVVGTPFYMSPEQAKGERDIDARADLFAVGVILFKAVTGTLPFLAVSFNELLFKIALEDAPLITERKADLDPELAAIVHRALQRDRTLRFASADAFREALQTWLGARGLASSSDQRQAARSGRGAPSTPSGTPPPVSASAFRRRALTAPLDDGVPEPDELPEHTLALLEHTTVAAPPDEVSGTRTSLASTLAGAPSAGAATRVGPGMRWLALGGVLAVVAAAALAVSGSTASRPSPPSPELAPASTRGGGVAAEPDAYSTTTKEPAVAKTASTVAGTASARAATTASPMAAPAVPSLATARPAPPSAVSAPTPTTRPSGRTFRREL